MAFGMSPFPLQFGSRGGGGAAGDPTALTQYNVDARLTALGLTQAGTGTTWGETGQAATPLYAVAAAKVPLAVETIAGKKYFGPIVNPAGTNLALYSSNGTNAAWVKTSCTAALALGGLEHDADWRGTAYLDVDFRNYADKTAAEADGWSFVEPTAGSTATIDSNGLTLTRGPNPDSPAAASKTVTSASGKFIVIEHDSSTGIRITGMGFAVLPNPTLSVVLATASTTITIYPASGFDASSTVATIRICEVDAHSLITSSSDNATCLQSITSTSGERVSKFWVSTDDTDVFVSHGAPTGSELVTNGGFDANTDWTKGTGWAISGGVATHSAGTSSAIVQDVGVEPYKIHRCIVTVTGRTSGSLYWRIGNQTNVGIMSSNSTFVQYLIAGSEDAEIELFADATFDGSIDNVSAQKVVETELTPGANPVAVDLAAYTGANPQLGIRIATSGDSVRLYGVQHQVAARSLRPRIGPTAGSSVTTGARTLTKTLSASPTAIDIEVAFYTGTPKDNARIFQLRNDANNQLLLYYFSTTEIRIYHANGGAIKTVAKTGIAPNTTYLMRVEASASVLRLTVDNGTPLTGASQALASGLTSIEIGANGSSDQLGTPILAFRDNLQNLLDAAPYGWNTRLLDTWT